MADYWKSLPKKYCDACKCWITDNKSSVNFHEQGKKHIDMVQKRLQELRKQGEIDYRAQQSVNTDLQKMEEAALRAYHKDLTSNPDLTARSIASKHTHVAKVIEHAAANPKTYKSGEAAALQAASSLGAGPGPSLPLLPKPKVWHEVQSPEGHSYYWNVDTQETTWEPPAEGYVTIMEQQLEELKNETEGAADAFQTSAEPVLNAKKKKKKKKKKQMFEDGYHYNYSDEDREAEERAEAAANAHNPYGQWQSVEPTPVAEPVDLQLPKIKFCNPSKTMAVAAAAAAASNEPRIKFAEKKSAAVDDVKREPGSSEFKKRKLNDDVKKNIRSRTDD